MTLGSLSVNVNSEEAHRNISLTTSSTPMDIEVAEVDVRAKEFSCKIIMKNATPDIIDIVSINYRIGSGIRIQKSEDSANIDLKEEYELLKSSLRILLNSIAVNKSEDFRNEYMRQMAEAFRRQLSWRKMVDVYIKLFLGSFDVYLWELRKNFSSIELPIASSSDAKKIYEKLKNQDSNQPLDVIIEAKISRMEKIESKDPDFFVNADSIARLLPGESFERIYILQCNRNFASIASYTAAFDLRVARRTASGSAADRSSERIISKTTSISVTPSPFTLSIYSIIFSFLGVLLSVLPDIKDYREMVDILSFQIIKQLGIASILAVIVYNTFEMTDLKDRIKSVSWRSAMLVGTLCGLLSDRMLQAIKSLVG